MQWSAPLFLPQPCQGMDRILVLVVLALKILGMFMGVATIVALGVIEVNEGIEKTNANQH